MISLKVAHFRWRKIKIGHYVRAWHKYSIQKRNLFTRMHTMYVCYILMYRSSKLCQRSIQAVELVS